MQKQKLWCWLNCCRQTDKKKRHINQIGHLFARRDSFCSTWIVWLRQCIPYNHQPGLTGFSYSSITKKTYKGHWYQQNPKSIAYKNQINKTEKKRKIRQVSTFHLGSMSLIHHTPPKPLTYHAILMWLDIIISMWNILYILH